MKKPILPSQAIRFALNDPEYSPWNTPYLCLVLGSLHKKEFLSRVEYKNAEALIHEALGYDPETNMGPYSLGAYLMGANPEYRRLALDMGDADEDLWPFHVEWFEALTAKLESEGL